jgi:hypothetical protein
MNFHLKPEMRSMITHLGRLSGVSMESLLPGYPGKRDDINTLLNADFLSLNAGLLKPTSKGLRAAQLPCPCTAHR